MIKNKQEMLCKYYDLHEVADEIHFVLPCPNYKDLRKELIRYIIVNKNPTLENKVEKLKVLFEEGS